MVNKNTTTFYIVRHGQTEANVNNLVQGHLESPLSSSGKKQIKKLARQLKNIPFDYIFSSDLKRAKQTADILAETIKLPINTTTQLRERFYGKFEGMKNNEFLNLYKNWGKLSDDERWNHRLENEETQQEIYKRFINFLNIKTSEFKGKNILIVCHGGIIRALLLKLKYGTWDSVGGIKNGGYVVLKSNGREHKIIEAVDLISWKDKKI